MKKIYSLALMAFCVSVSAKAEIVNITVKSNQFTPANTNVTVGDVLHFTNTTGFHNVTSAGTVIPAGAAQMNSGNPASGGWTYDYTVAVEGVYHYYCEVHSSDGTTGMIGTITASGSTPVTLKLFNITTINKKPVAAWSTASESNVDYFSVRSSIDGIHYTEVGKVTAKGNSNAQVDYSFPDSKAYTNRYVYYELVIKDKDGKESYSKIAMFKNELSSKTLITQLSPNPVKMHDHVMIQYNSEKAGKLRAYVYDASGKLATKADLESVPGLNNGHIHMCGFAAGIYTIVFSLDGIKETRKVVVE